MWRWMMRTSAVFLFSTLCLTSPASAHPKFYVNFGVPGIAVGVGNPYYYPGYVYPGYAYAYPGYAYPYPGYVYGYPRYAYPSYGYAWQGGYRGYYGHRYYGGGGRYVRPYGHAGWHGDRHWHR